jgi:hypothetical protein
MKRQTIGILKAIQKMGVRAAALSVLLVASSVAAMAQCGDSLNAMATAAALGRSQSEASQPVAQSLAENQSAASDNAVNTSIVGLWHIRFLVGGQKIQEAFQIWNAGGTEVHNPNVDPRTGNVCLGAWKEAGRTFRLTHRVWLYDTNGNFQGTGHLSETLVLGDRGDTHSGSFTLAFYDPTGNFQSEVSGTVVGERISPD